MLASLGSLGGLAGAAGLKNPADQYIAFLKSNSVKDALIDRFKLMELLETTSKEKARARIGSARITAGKDGLITVEFDHKDPKFAAEVANAYVDELRHLLGRMAVTEAQQRRLFFEKQLIKAKENLTAAEQALKATGISDSVLKSNPASAVASVAALKAQINAQEVKIGGMRGYLAETAPDIKQAITELVNLRSQLIKQEKEDMAPAKLGQGDYISRYRDFKYYESLYELFAKQYEIARVDEAREGAVIQVLDAAEPSERKSKPRKGLITITATLVAGFILLLFVFIRQALRKVGSNSVTADKLAQIQTSLLQALGKT